MPDFGQCTEYWPVCCNIVIIVFYRCWRNKDMMRLVMCGVSGFYSTLCLLGKTKIPSFSFSSSMMRLNGIVPLHVQDTQSSLYITSIKSDYKVHTGSILYKNICDWSNTSIVKGDVAIFSDILLLPMVQMTRQMKFCLVLEKESFL